MTDNPFNSEGGFDFNAMLEQAQQMQSQLVAAQEELASTSVEGSAGGVTVTLTGTGELTAVTIRPGTFEANDADSLTDLGDLVVAAYRDGKAQVDAIASQMLGPLAGGGMDLGGGRPDDLSGQLGGQPDDQPEDRPGPTGGFGV